MTRIPCVAGVCINLGLLAVVEALGPIYTHVCTVCMCMNVVMLAIIPCVSLYVSALF